MSSCTASVKATIRERFRGTYIAAGGFDLAAAEKVIATKQADLVAFGRPFLANPDLVTRFARNLPLATPDMSLAFTPGSKGYIDYPTANVG